MDVLRHSRLKSNITGKSVNRIMTGFVVLGIFLRCSLVFTSTNFDFESYKITSDLILGGEPPWRGQRYNYGITWSLVLSILRLLSFENDLLFRILIVGVLTAADLTIALILKKWFGAKTACIFFINPISIMVTGHYNQFDNLSIAVAVWAMNYLVKYLDFNIRTDLTKSILLFSLSLTIKHNLALFLIWFVFLKFNKKVRAALIGIPALIFLAHFVPFMLISKFDRESVLSAVFKYWSSNNAPFWKFWFWDKDFAESLGSHTAWHHGRLWNILMILSVSVVGYLVRRLDLRLLIPIYTLALITFSSAITSQFLAIAAVGAAVFFNVGFLGFFMFETVCLFADPAGLDIQFLRDFLSIRGWNSWNTAPTLIVVAVFIHFWRRRLTSLSNFSRSP